MKRFSASVAISVLIASPAFSQEAPWGFPEIHAFVSEFDPANEQVIQDPFALPVFPRVTTDRILLIGRLPTHGVTSTGDLSVPAMGFIKYDAKTHHFEITVHVPQLHGSEGVLPDLNGRQLFNMKVDGEYRGENLGIRTNAYGASVNVTRNTSFNTSIAQVRRDSSSLVFDSYIRSGGYYKTHLIIEPDAARELSQHIQVRVYATPTPLADGTPVVCTRFRDAATITNPVEYDTTTCHLLVKFDKLEVVDTRDENVLFRLLPKR